MKALKGFKLGLTAVLALSLAISPVLAGEAKGANEDAPNTQKSDETVVIALASEPSGLFMGGSGKLETEMVIIQDAFTDELVNVDPNTNEVLP